MPTIKPAIRVTAMPADAEVYGDIFGGWLLGQMDLAAGSAPRGVTAAIDAVSFLHPVKVGNEVSVFATMASIGPTSPRIVPPER